MDVSSIQGVVSSPLSVQPPAAPPPPSGPGKSGMAVGQIAKQAVSDARAAGIGLPRNAQGMAASQIAKGADPASVFAALATPEGDPVDSIGDGGSEGQGDVPIVADGGDGVDLPDDGPESATVPANPNVDDASADEDSAALALITQAADQYAATTGALAAGDSSSKIALDLLS